MKGPGPFILAAMRARSLAPACVLAASAVLGCGGGSSGAAPIATPSPERTAGATPSGTPSAAATGVRLRRIGRFQAPVYVTSPPGDRTRLFVVEQGGRIRVLVNGRPRARPFLDIAGKVRAGGEQGLLSMAFAPDYARSGRFYVDYTDNDGDTRIVEYRRATRTRADPASARQLIFQRQPEVNHNGGLLLFGPDRRLYVGLGDGGGGGDRHGARGNAQDLGTLLGKILRIDPRRSGGRPYTIPAGNPFAGRAGARKEIWAYGLRNPWRFTFAPQGQLVIADVGQDAVEEVDVIRNAGVNLGWRVFEGASRYTRGESAPGAVRPDITRRHADGWCSITGGVVVRSDNALRGRYLFGDYCKGDIESARIVGSGVRDVRSTRLHVDALASFGTDARGRAYAVSNNGPVYRIVAR
jgi:glucose/arabinose dehydrogenase